MVYECAGVSEALQQAIKTVKAGGQIIMIGASIEPTQINTMDIIMKEVQIQVSFGYLPEEYPMVLELMKTRKIDVNPLITEIIPLKDLPKYFDILKKPNKKEIITLVEF